MNAAWLALISLPLLAWTTDLAPAVSVRDSTSLARCLGHTPRVRFRICHARNGIAGPRISPDRKVTVQLQGPLQARLVEVGSGNPVGLVLRHSRRREAMRIHDWSFSPDGRLVATASSDGEGEDTVGEVRVWEVATGRLVAVARDARFDLGRVHAIAFFRGQQGSPDPLQGTERPTPKRYQYEPTQIERRTFGARFCHSL
jgi:hypothetical protein